MIISNVMTKDPICVTEETSIVEAKQIMEKNDFGKLPVLDKSKRLVGIITKNDISKVSPSDATTLDKYEINSLLSKLTCGKCMTKKVITVPDTAVVEEAARIMVDKEIGCVPVVKDDVVIGIVTESDLFALFTDMFGARYSGARVNFEMEDKPGQLSKCFAKFADEGANIVSVITRESKIAGFRRVTLKATGIAEAKVKSILEECGAEIIDLRVV